MTQTPTTRHRHLRLALLGLVLLGTAAFVMTRPPLRQDPAYHRFVDERSLLGIPNALNVLSNLSFAVVGTLGLAITFGRRSNGTDDPWVRWPYAALFGGTLLTAFGSSYYHLSPDNARLVWDRLPMTLAFMGLVAAVVAERVSIPLSRAVLIPLLLLGVGSVGYWYWSELCGAGDLRPYLLVQFGSLLAIVLLLALFPKRGAGTPLLAAGLLAYAAAKALESADRMIFALGHVVSGHTLKHMAAALGVACVAAMLAQRGRPSRDGMKR